jgi:uncharacterized membrane protein YgcG
MGIFDVFGRKSGNTARKVQPQRATASVAIADNAMLYLLDRSGSMSSAVGDLVKGINSSIENNRRDPLAKTTECHIVTFDSLGFDRIRARETMADLRPITEKEVAPRAATPLNDAIGYCIDPILEEPQRGRKILIIFTDGLENSSKKYADVALLRSRVKEFERRGNIVIFLAANLDAQKVGAELGIAPERSMNTRANGKPGTGPGMTYAFMAAAGLGLAYWALSSGSAEAAPAFTDDDRKESMGGSENWQDEIQSDIAEADVSAESIMNLEPEVVEQVQNLPEDFDPSKGSLDNPESENYAESEASSDDASSSHGDDHSSSVDDSSHSDVPHTGSGSSSSSDWGSGSSSSSDWGGGDSGGDGGGGGGD